MKICISLSGENTKKTPEVAHASDIVIASDGGYDKLAIYGIIPDYFIGDNDSSSLEVPEKTKKIIFPSEKDFSDAELSVDFALSFHPEKIYLVNALGKRPDHYFSNLSLLFKKPQVIEIVDDEWSISAVSGPCEITLKGNFKDKIFSIFPFGENIKGLSLKGFQYEVINTDIRLGSRGLSNVFTSDTAEVSLREGISLIFVQK
ncbi:thiamine diphosphokinase [candidate division WOR-3 bacterium]|nr:thiamine diphosphokinase [candidate division WOR-3 bacterium]